MTTLDELRRANLKEQRGDAAERPAPAAAPPAPSSESAPAAEYKNGHSDTAPSRPEPVQTPPPAGVRDQDLKDRVQKALSRKAIHPTGVKATVDMSPELFWRVKRYCRDHNNVTVRQLFLDVVSIYLDEEGY